MGDGWSVPALPTRLRSCDLQTRILDIEGKDLEDMVFDSPPPCGMSVDLGCCLADVWVDYGCGTVCLRWPTQWHYQPTSDAASRRNDICPSNLASISSERYSFPSSPFPQGKDRGSGDMISDAWRNASACLRRLDSPHHGALDTGLGRNANRIRILREPLPSH